MAKGIHKGQRQRELSKRHKEEIPPKRGDLVGRGGQKKQESGVKGEETGDQEKEGTRETSGRSWERRGGEDSGEEEAGRGAGGRGAGRWGRGRQKVLRWVDYCEFVIWNGIAVVQHLLPLIYGPCQAGSALSAVPWRDRYTAVIPLASLSLSAPHARSHFTPVNINVFCKPDIHTCFFGNIKQKCMTLFHYPISYATYKTLRKDV